MTETVKAVTGINLEYSRFHLPNKATTPSVSSLYNPDCNCFPTVAQYQFPLNWDTGPEQLDVFFYPRNYSGSDLSLFNGTQGLSRNINQSYSQYNYSNLGQAYITDAVDNDFTPITLTKTENVFDDYENIPQKRISSTLNQDESYAVFYDTHQNISRKCWAGTGTLGGDEVLVIYSYSRSGISLVLCYLGNSNTECIHANDQAHGPHAVIIDLTPGTSFGSKPVFNTLEYYWFNDSFYYALNMGKILAYYTFSNSFGNYWNGWYNWGYVYGLDNLYSANYYDQNYYSQDYLTGNLQTQYAPYVKDEPLANTSNWLCRSGRPQSVYHNMTDTTIPNWRATTEQEKEEAPKNFGTGIDTFQYINVYWSTLGAVNAVPEVTAVDCQNNSYVLQSALPARVADTEPDWENPFVLVNDDGQGNLTYTLSPLLNGWNYYYWGYNWYYYQSWYLRFVDNNPNWYPGFANGNPVSGADCYTYNWYYGYYGGYFNFYGYGPSSSGVWEINPDVPGAVAYACGTPVNETALDDGTTTYSVMELIDVKTVDVSWPMFGIDGPAYQAMYNAYACTVWNGFCPPAYYYPYKQIGTIPAKYTKAVYKVSTVNLPITLGTPNYLRITDDELQEFPLAQVNREYITEPGYLRSTYYGTVEAKAKKIGRSDYNYLGNYCYSYGYDSIKYQVYPAPEVPEGEEPPADLIINNCNSYSNYYYNWWYADQRFLSLKFKSSYVPYFFSGVRPHEGLNYPPNLTEPKVRIFPGNPPNPEEFRDSNYPKYYFQEFDPSQILVSNSKLLAVPPLTVTDPPTPDTKIYLPDYENTTTKPTILPRASAMLQTVAEQSEYFQCEYLKGEFNDWYYYFPPSFLSNGGIDERLDFPENIYGCDNTLVPSIPEFRKPAFLFDITKGEEQLRSSGAAINYYSYYNALSIFNMDYPEITAMVYQVQREEIDKKKREYPTYIPAWFHVYGTQVYDWDYIPSGTSFEDACNYTYGIKEIVLGGTDLCSPITLSNGVLSPCNINYKKIEPTYSVMTGTEYYDAYDESRALAQDAYEAALIQATFHAQPLAYEFRYVTSYTFDSNTGICNPNYTTLAYTWYTLMVDQAYITGGNYYYGYSQLTGFTKSYYDKTLPVWGRVSGLYFYNGYYNYYNPYGWGFNPVGGDTSFLDCEVLVTDLGFNARKQQLTGNNLSSNYSNAYYGGYYNYYGYGNVQNLNISDLQGWGIAVTFINAGALYKQIIPDPQYCGTSCYTPTASTDVFYFDLVASGGNSFFYNYGYASWNVNSWLTGETYCQTTNEYGTCVNTGAPVRLSPALPEPPPYNPCDPADYVWVEPCTRFYS